MTKWTKAEDEILTKEWCEGIDARLIAGHPMLEKNGRTRNSVISRAHRLNLPPHSSQQLRTKANSIHASAGRKKGAPVFLPVQPVVKEQVENPVEAQEIGDADTRPGAIGAISRLKNDQCRFPTGDVRSDDFDFCKNKKAKGMSYCPECAKKAYQPPSLTRRTDDRIRHLVTREKANA